MFFSSFFLACRVNFALTYQRRVGANTDPDFLEFAFSPKHFPPDGSQSQTLPQSALSTRLPVRFAWKWKEKRKALSSEVPKIVAEDLPNLPLLFNDVVSVHRRALGPSDPSSRGDYFFPCRMASQRSRLPSSGAFQKIPIVVTPRRTRDLSLSSLWLTPRPPGPRLF